MFSLRPIAHRFRKLQDSGFFEEPIVMYALLIAVAAICYGQTLFFEFINHDDPILLLHNENLRNFTLQGILDLLTKTTQGTFTPVRYLSHMLDFWIWGDRPFGHHLSNVIFHTINGCLAFHLLLQLGFSRGRALFAGLLFLAHPVTVESVSWVSARKELLFTMFLLISCGQFIKFLKREQKSAIFLSTISYVAACLSKATAVVFSPLFVLLAFLTKGKRRTDNILHSVLFILISAIVGMLHYFHFLEALPPPDVLLWQRFLTAQKALGKHLANLILPYHLSPFEQIEPVRSLVDPVNLLFVIGTVSLFFLLVVALSRNKYRSAGLCLILFILPLLPVLISPNTIRTAANRYIYFSAIPFSALLAIVFVRQRRLLMLPGLFLLTIYLALNISYGAQWHDSQKLYQHLLKTSPQNPFLLSAFASHLYARGDAEGAYTLAIDSCRQEPTFSNPLITVAAIFHKLGYAEPRDLILNHTFRRITPVVRKDYEALFRTDSFATRRFVLPHPYSLSLHNDLMKKNMPLAAFLVLWNMHVKERKNVVITLYLAKYCAYMGLLPIAEPLLDSFHPEPDSVLYHQAQMVRLFNTQRFRDALMHATWVLKLAPGDPTAQIILRRLEKQ